jgi:ribonuclease HI
MYHKCTYFIEEKFQINFKRYQPNSKQDKTGGWGFVIRNDEGQVVKAGAGREDFLQDAFHAELLGVLSGVREAATLGISCLIIETDATIYGPGCAGRRRLQAVCNGRNYHESEASGVFRILFFFFFSVSSYL